MTDLNVKTMNDVFALASGRGENTAMLWKDATGAWTPIQSGDLYGRVLALARALGSRGVGKSDRVAILSENRWEWAVTDFAVLALGAADVPLYPTLTAEQVGYMLRDSGAKVAVVSSREQYEKLTKAGEMPELEHVVVMDAGEFGGAESFARLIEGASSERDAGFDARSAETKPDDLATIIYTSGTTGEPKGVKLTHGNLASNLVHSTTPFGFGEGDRCISFLPLSHVTARHLDYALMCRAAAVAYCPKIDFLKDAMQVVRPTIFVGVPRVYEKIRQGVECKSTGLKEKILHLALVMGKQHRKDTLLGRQPQGFGWKLADKLVFSKIRAAFGGQVRIFVSGGAPLGMDTAGWFADVGIRIFEGYGLTETSPVIALNYPEAHRIGTVGKPLPNVEIQFAPDGELEIRGPSVFNGYWNKERETSDAFAGEKWFKTGDIGKIDAEGFLSITDRKKELIKTSGGKFIAPQPIENKLKANTLVGHAALVGDKRKFAAVLISPNFGALETWAKGQGVSTGDRAAIVKDAKVITLYKGVVDKVNKELAPYETMKKVAVVADEWSLEDGTLTPSMKLKRRVVELKYKDVIAGFYNDEGSKKE